MLNPRNTKTQQHEQRQNLTQALDVIFLAGVKKNFFGDLQPCSQGLSSYRPSWGR